MVSQNVNMVQDKCRISVVCVSYKCSISISRTKHKISGLVNCFQCQHLKCIILKAMLVTKTVRLNTTLLHNTLG